MTADTYSARLGILKMGTGNQNNSWGDSFNASATDVTDRAIAGVITRAVTGGTLDVSASPPPAAMRQDIDAIQIFTGVLTANQTFIVPNLSKIWKIFNNTTGAFQLFVKTTAGTAVQVPQGTQRDLWCDGANNIYREDSDEVGKFTHSGRTTPANGELACDGSSRLRADFPDLFTAIGATWGSVDGTHFTLPLLTDTNRFLRAAGGALAVGTYQANQNLAHTHPGATFSGTTSTESTGITFNYGGTTSGYSADHTHTYNARREIGLSGSISLNDRAPDNSYTTSGQSNNHTHTFSGTTSTQNQNHTHTYSGTTGTIPSAGGTEARPESAAVLICIKY